MRGTALLIASFLCLAILGIRGQDPTYDEARYFGAGKAILETYEWKTPAALLHPPLSQYVNSLPLFWTGRDARAQDPLALLLCRLASLLVFGVPLLVVIGQWAKRIYGPAAGLVALTLACFSPTLLAHAPLLTPDLALTTTGFVAVYLFRNRGQGREGWLGWGLFLGLSLLAKGSAWLFVLSIAILGALAVWNTGEPRTPWVRKLVAGLAVALLVLNLGYGFKGLLDAEGKAALLAELPAGVPGLRALAAVAAAPFPLPYLQSMVTQAGIGWRGVPAFLMGEVSPRGWWYYFLIAFLIKETVPFLILLAVSAAAFRWTRGPWFDELSLLVPVLLFLGCFSFVGRLDIGIRYLLPAFPFLFVFASKLVRIPERWRRDGRWLLGGLLAAHAASALRACPDFIAYFNELVGGPRNGYRWLVDSNLDWGQNRSRAVAYATEHGIPFEPTGLPSSGQVIVSANRLQGILSPERYRLLREEYEPVGQIGYNWLIYDLERNRRFPAEAILPVVSGGEWVAAGAAALTLSTDEFVPSRAYPGTAAVLMGCPGDGKDCRLERSFSLQAPPAQAVLHFAARDRYVLLVNERAVASRTSCPDAFLKEQLRLTPLLRAGVNSIRIGITACGDSPRGVFVEMRVAQALPPS